MINASVTLSNVLIFTEAKEPTIYTNVIFFVEPNNYSLQLNYVSGKKPNELNDEEKNCFKKILNLTDRDVDFNNSKLTLGSKNNYTITIK